MPIRGFADLHSHPMAHLGFGGKALAGKPWDAYGVGIAKALERCDATGQFHGPWQSGGGNNLVSKVIAALIRFKAEANHGACGHSGFQNWPSFRTVLHQQMYVDWVRRAYDGGLRLMCALMVNNELLASAFGGVIYADGWSIDAQMRGLKEFVKANATWVGIASTPAEARAHIAANRLAIVPGVEVDSLDSLARTFDPPQPVGAGRRSLPTEDLLHNPLQSSEVDVIITELKRIGIAMVTPLHVADNSFGGAAIYQDMFNVLNRYLRDGYFDVEADPSVAFRVGSSVPVEVVRAFLFHDALPNYGNVTGGGHRNSRGLTPVGEAFIRAAMKAGLVIDVDHMSTKCTDGVLDAAERADYPVVSSHSAFRDQGLTTETQVMPKKCHEGQKTRLQALRILQLGGLVAPITNQHELKPHPSGSVANDCPGSSKTWAQSYLYALDVLTDAGTGGVAVGTDFNGMAEQPNPRFGPYAAFAMCEDRGRPEQGREAEYTRNVAAQLGTELQYGNPTFFDPTKPLTQATLPTRSAPFNFNVDGLAHYGLLPDFIEDLLKIGVTAQQLDPLFRSAEAFVTMWEKCQTRAPLVP